MSDFERLCQNIRACHHCPDLPLGPRPLFSASPQSRIALIGQAPGRLTHIAGTPFDDASGQTLRAWLGVTRAEFYRPEAFAIVPMGLCYPGTGRSGDLPPRAECAPLWHESLFSHLSQVELRILIGRYAQKAKLPKPLGRLTLTRLLQNHWSELWDSGCLVIPHPSPRNRRWLARNRWFEERCVPQLQERVRQLLCELDTKSNSGPEKHSA